jgi:hypothetical protein
MPYADSLLARGVISGGAMANLLRRINDISRDRSRPPMVGPEMAPRGGPRTYTGASGEKIVAPNYGETIKGPAIRAGKDVFQGANHGDALDNLREAYPYEKYKEAVNSLEEGFVTSHGRFVGREEALDIAKRGSQYQTAGHDYPEALVTENLQTPKEK